MSGVMITSDSSPRPSISSNGALIRKMTSTAGDTQTKKKRHTRSNPPDVFAALNAEDVSPSASSSSSFRAVRPIGVKALKDAPLIDERIEQLLYEREAVKKPSPSFETTKDRAKHNNGIGFVSALRLYPVQEMLARYVTMREFEAVACTSAALSGSLNLEETREEWKTKFENGEKARMAARREEYYEALDTIPETRKRQPEEDEEVGYVSSWHHQSRGRKRIKAVSGHV